MANTCKGRHKKLKSAFLQRLLTALPNTYQPVLQHDVVQNIRFQQAMQMVKHIMKADVPLMGWGLSLGRNVISCQQPLEYAMYNRPITFVTKKS